MRSWSPLALFAVLACWLVPAAVHAQTGYEPDQRGDLDDPEQAEPDALYEPDQRGDLEGDEETSYDATVELDAATPRSGESERAEPATPGAALMSAEVGAAERPSFALELRLGPAITRIDDATNVGFAFGLFGGARLGSLTLGPRFDLTIDPDLVVGAFALEAQLSLSESTLEPVLRAAAGYAFLSGPADTLSAFHLEAGLGLRWNLSSTFAIGTDLAFVGLIPHGWQGKISLDAVLRF